jgi:hypothetical protein
MASASSAASVEVDGARVLEGLNVSATEIAELEQGDILSFSDEAYESTARDLAADAVVLVDTDAAAVLKLLEDAVSVVPGKKVLDHSEIKSEADFMKVSYNESEYDEVSRLFKAKPGKDFNFSAAEYKMVKTTLGPVRNGSKAEKVKAASNVIRDILTARYNSYRTKGLAGIDSYQRSRSKVINVSEELLLATKTFEPFKNDFPAFYEVLENYPQGADCCEHKYRWLKLDVRDQPTFVLTHTIIRKTEDYILYTERFYFVSSTLDSLQVTLSWLPYDEDTYMGLAMSASTDILDSLLGRMLRPLGRNKAKKMVADVVDDIRVALQKDDGAAENKN